MKSSLINSIGEVVTDYGARVMKVFKKGLLGRSLFDFYGDVKADAIRSRNMLEAPETPFEGGGGIMYTKASDGKLYYKSNEVAEVELSANGGTITTTDAPLEGEVLVYSDSTIVWGHPEKIHLQVRNDEGATIPAGAPLYSKGEIGGSNRILVGIADADDSAKMPCIGLAEAEMNTTSTKDNFAITQGVYNTNISGFTGLAVGNTLYVDTSGSAPHLTKTKPTGESSLIQNVGIVLKTNGSICQGLQVSAIGRTNDVPNLDQNALFIGNASNQAVQTDAPMVGVITAADAGAARTALGVDAAGTDNSTNVTLAGTPDYITISGQEITRNAIDLTADVSGTLPVANGGTGQTDLSNVSVGTATALTSGDKTIDGDLQINGNDIKDDDGTTCITFDSSGNTTIAGTTNGTFSGTLTGNVNGNVTGNLTGDVSGNVAGVVTGSLVGNVNGDVTGDVTGNVSGNVSGNVNGVVTGSLIGNASTATSLETARNIGGVSFNGTADINLPGVNTSGSQDTSGNAATATALAAGNQTIDGDVTIGANGAGHDFKLYGDTSLATVLWDSTYDFLKFSDLTKIVFGSGVHASDFDSSIQANGSNLVIYNDTGNIQIGDTVEITGDLTTTGGIELGHASDTTIARSAAGEVTIEGKKIITENKVKQQFNLTFIDDIGTTQHYLSWRDQYENSSSTSSDYQDTNYLVPANGRVVAVYLRVGNITATSDMTVKVYSQNAGFMQSQSQQEAESTTITATGDKFEVFAFYFDNAEHFQAGDLVLISVQNGTDAGGSQTYHVTAVLEFDYTQMGRTDSGELA